MGASSTREIQKKPTVQRREQEQSTENLQKQEGHAHPSGEVNLNRSIINGNPVQAKLTMGSVGDKYEQEADETADKAMSKTMNGSFSGGADDESPAVSKQSFLQTQLEETPEVSQKSKEDRISQQKFLQTTLYNEDKDTKNDMVNAMADETISKQDFLQALLFDEDKDVKNDMINAKEEEAVQSKEEEIVQQKGAEEETSIQQMSDEESLQSKEEESQVQLKEEENSLQSKTEEETAVQPKEQEEPVQQMSDEESVQSKEEEMVQAKGESRLAKIESMLATARAGGRPMNRELLAEMEQRFGGIDFSNVRIHTDDLANKMCKMINARAFTNGRHIYFAAGQFDPESTKGKILLAHELTHTIQQGASFEKIQQKPSDHEVDEDGKGVDNRMDQKFKDEGIDDADQDEEVPEIDPAEKAEEKGEMKSSGIAKPSVDRPAKEKPKVQNAEEEGKKKQEEVPETETEKEKEEEPPRADLTPVDEFEANALVALKEAQGMKRPKKPKKLKKPKIQTPKDSKNQKLPANVASDKAVRAMHEIAKLFVEQSYELKTEAYEGAKAGKQLKSMILQGHSKIASASIGAKLMREDNLARDTINEGQETALVKVEEDTAFVKKEAPGILSEAKEGKSESAPLKENADEQKKETAAQEPDDPEAAVEAKKQTEETGQVADGSESMDQAFGDSVERTQQYLDEAIVGEEKNKETKGKIEANKETSTAAKAELDRLDEHNTASLEEMSIHDPMPEMIEAQTAKRAASGDELYTAAVVMNDQLIDIQDEYLDSMSQLEGKEEAQKKIDDEEKAKQQAKGAAGEEGPVLTPEEEMIITMSEMGEEELNALLIGMDEEELVGMESTLNGMETAPDADDNKNKLLSDPDKDGRVKVDLMKMFESEDANKQPPDPRQPQIDAIEGRRSERIGLVKQISDANYIFLTGEQKAMLAEKLAIANTVDAVSNMSLIDFGKAAINGLLNPVESLKGVVDGASQIATGVVNLLSAEAWKEDPLGNLLQSSASIATGLTNIFASITALATTMTILTGVVIVLSWFTLAAPLAPFLSFLTSVITTVGGWTIVTGLIAAALNELTRVKNLHDASVSTNTDELLFETDQVQQNMTDEAMMLMAVVGAKGDVTGAKALQRNILKAGGAKSFQVAKGELMKQGIKQTGKNVVNFVKGGVLKGTKQLAVQGAKRLKQSFKNAIQRIRKGFKEAPGNIKNKAKAEWKAFKESFSPAKKVETIDTPHGKLRKAPEGGDLGSFKGEKVKAEMDFPDGHKAKNLESGKCAICSNCEKIQNKFGDELALEKNKDLADDLKKVEAELAAKPGDPDLIAKQKAMHDKLYKDKLERLNQKKTEVDPNSQAAKDLDAEIDATKTERVDNQLDIYDQKVKDGQFTRGDKTDAEIDQIKKNVQDELDSGRVVNPETGKFHADGTPKIDYHATPTQNQFGIGDNTSAAGKKGVQEINISHSDMSVKKQRKLMVAEEMRVRGKAKKAELEETFNQQGYIEVVEDGVTVRYTDLEKVPEYKAAQQQMINASEQLGEISTDAVMNTALPGAKKLAHRPGSKNPNAKSGEFDAIYEHNGDIYIVESKGGGAQRGSRKIEDGKRAEQGTVEYRDDIIKQMEKEVAKTGDPELTETLRKIKDALDTGEVKYLQVTQTVDPTTGKVTPQANVIKFE